MQSLTRWCITKKKHYMLVGDNTVKEVRDNYGKYYTNKYVKKQIDMRLEKMASIECNTGVDSTPVELSKAKRKKKKLLLEIKKLDQTFYETISVSI